MDRLAVAYHVDDGFYPNVGRVGRTGSEAAARRTYWSNILVLAASVHRWSDGVTALEVHTNDTAPADLVPHLDALAVVRRRTPFTYVPPGAVEDYRASFYLFDVLSDLLGRMAEGDRAGIVDPDCVFVDRIDRLWERVDRDGLVAHRIDQPANLVRHGHSRASLGEIFTEEHGATTRPPMWVGGELLAFSAAQGHDVAELAREGWDRSLARHAAGKPYLRSDEHLHAYVLWRLGWQDGNADDLIARLYTNTFPLPRNVSRVPRTEEFGLAVWHLPGEKDVGLKELARSAVPPDGALLSLDDDAYREHVARAVGIVPTLRRRVRDEVRRLGRVPYRLRHRLDRP